MSKEILPTKIESQFTDVLGMIEKSKKKALKAVNIELIDLYWELGKYINARIETSEWGESVVDQLASFLKGQRPDIKGFSRSSLFVMKQFYCTWKDNEKVPALLGQINWTNHKRILTRKLPEEREFYLHLAANQNYSSRELERQIKSGLFERLITSEAKASLPLKESHPDAEWIFRDRYVLEFLNLPKDHSEKDLRKGIVAHLKDFILEFGNDFTFMGEEYRVDIGGDDFFVDLLFFHRGLKCLVAFELKVDKFKPSHLGQMSFYLAALDKTVKRDDENPSVGILLCKEANAEVVEMSLNTSMSPTLVAEYKTKLIDKDLLQQKFHEILEISAKEKQ